MTEESASTVPTCYLWMYRAIQTSSVETPLALLATSLITSARFIFRNLFVDNHCRCNAPVYGEIGP